MNIAAFLLGLASVLVFGAAALMYALNPPHPRAAAAATTGFLLFVLSFMALYLWSHTTHIVHF